MKRNTVLATLLLPLQLLWSGARETTAGEVDVSQGSLSQRLRGISIRMVLDQPVGGIDTVLLPALTASVARPRQAQRISAIHALGGPDDAGWVYFLESRPDPLPALAHGPTWLSVAAAMLPETDPGLVLKRCRLDGSNEEALHSNQDRPIRNAGGTVAVSRSGWKVALITDGEYVGVFHKRAGFRVGRLDIWNTRRGQRNVTPLPVIQEETPMVWDADERRLIHTELLSWDKVTTGLPGRPEALRYQSNWDAVPCVCYLNSETSELTILAAGQQPIVAPDGKHLLFLGADNKWFRLSLSDRTVDSVSLPAEMTRPIAWLTGDLVLGWGTPDPSAPARLTSYNSPLVGPKRLVRIGLGRIDGTEFEPVLTEVDPRRLVVVGVRPAAALARK